MSEDKKDSIVPKILNDYTLCPALLIGKMANEFKREYKGTVVRIYTLNEVRAMLDEYEGIEAVESGLLVLDGIGYLSHVGQDGLLKFLEESRVPIVLLSFVDKVSPIIMSRMKTVVKEWFPVKSLSFMTEKSARSELSEKKKEGKMKDYEVVQYLADNCPPLYSLYQKAGDPYDHMNEKMMDLICIK